MNITNQQGFLSIEPFDKLLEQVSDSFSFFSTCLSTAWIDISTDWTDYDLHPYAVDSAEPAILRLISSSSLFPTVQETKFSSTSYGGKRASKLIQRKKKKRLRGAKFVQTLARQRSILSVFNNSVLSKESSENIINVGEKEKKSNKLYFHDLLYIMENVICSFLTVRDLTNLSSTSVKIMNICSETVWRDLYQRDVVQSLESNGYAPRAVIYNIRSRAYTKIKTANFVEWLSLKLDNVIKSTSSCTGLPSVSDYKLLIIDEFILIQEDKIKILEERLDLLGEMDAFRLELQQLLDTSTSNQIREQLQILLNNRPEKKKEIQDIKRNERPKIVKKLRILKQSMIACLRRSKL